MIFQTPIYPPSELIISRVGSALVSSGLLSEGMLISDQRISQSCKKCQGNTESLVVEVPWLIILRINIHVIVSKGSLITRLESSSFSCEDMTILR